MVLTTKFNILSFDLKITRFLWISSLRKKSQSSSLWLERQKRDPYVKASAKLNYRARSAFKLLEIDDKHAIFSRGQIILDCGAAPGSWSQVAVQRTRGRHIGEKPQSVRQLLNFHKRPVGFEESEILSFAESPESGIVIGFDLNAIAPLKGALFLSHTDINADDTRAKITEVLGEYTRQFLRKEHQLNPRCIDVVLSDMAPNSTGVAEHDQVVIGHLAKSAFSLARHFLKPGGILLFKLWDGYHTDAVVRGLTTNFSRVNIVKPESSRTDSSEIFVLARDFKLRK